MTEPDPSFEAPTVALFLRSLAGVGPVRVFLDLAAALAARGYRVDLLVAYGSGAYRDRVPPGVQLVDLRAPVAQACLPALVRRPGLLRALGPIVWLPGAPRVLGAIPALARYLARARPATLLAAQHYGNLAAVCAHALADSDARLLLSQRTQISDYLRAGRTPRKRLVLGPVRRLYPRAAAVIAVSRGVAADLCERTGLDPARVPVIPNPVVDDGLPERAALPSGHPWLDQPDGTPVLLAAGRLHYQKDFPTLLRAFARLRADRAARLVILGEGRGRRALEQQARQLGVAADVDMPGFVDNPFAFMARASAFVLSSRYEGLPGVLIQALACDCPVVSTDCPSGPAEILEDGRWGRLVAVGDDRAMADALVATLADPPAPGAVRQRAGAFTMARILTLYLQQLSPAPGGGVREG
ncbi:glycosyltransferase [Arhodomonas sp. KWT2]|uniref:glycosyltransferase n=1 Tax=unclassified Arhodomonas TaxID=2621637 RepID=UPI001F089075|nr:glycosyltransferase [Arhodomonas sp. KWT]